MTYPLVLMGQTSPQTRTPQSAPHIERRYCGNYIYSGPALSQILIDGGYITLDSSGNPSYYFYVQDHQGNNRLVLSASGGVEEVNSYYPYGGLMSMSTASTQRFKYNGKELNQHSYMMWYDYGARQSAPLLGRFTSMDQLCENYYPFSPYAYCVGNPVRFVDPDGKSTWVKNIGNGKYEIIGGNLYDNDRNIYVYSLDKDGNYSIRGRSIGQTTSMTSFYNSDKEDEGKRWQRGSIIDMKDVSGKIFLRKILSPEVTLFDYIPNARNGKPYDFKITNGTNNIIDNIDFYRGMPSGKSSNGQALISSARDIGNIAAGIVAAKHGISWIAARCAFDAYQSKSVGHIEREGMSTRNAQYYGWSMMHSHSSTYSEIKNLRISLVNFINKFF